MHITVSVKDYVIKSNVKKHSKDRSLSKVHLHLHCTPWGHGGIGIATCRISGYQQIIDFFLNFPLILPKKEIFVL